MGRVGGFQYSTEKECKKKIREVRENTQYRENYKVVMKTSCRRTMNIDRKDGTKLRKR